MFSELTASGWIFMIMAWGSVIGLTIFCLVKVLSGEKDLSTVDKD